MNPHVITPLIRSSVALLLLGLSALLSSLQAQAPTDSLRLDGGWEAFIESQLQVGLLTEEEQGYTTPYKGGDDMRIHCAHGGDIRVLVWGTLLVKVLKV